MAKPFTISGTPAGCGHNSDEKVVPNVPVEGGKHKTARDLPSAEKQNIPWPESQPLDQRATKTQKPFRVK